MKQITIYEFLKKNECVIQDGWVAMNQDKSWSWFNYYPTRGDKLVNFWYGRAGTQEAPLFCFDIAPFDGDWKDSLIKVEHKEEQ